jgi:hypothetical protein
VERFNEQELLQRLRNVVMLKDPSVKPYAGVFASLESIAPGELAPPQNYILRGELKKVRELKWALAEHGVDLFRLDGFVRVGLADSPEPMDVLPPVVEESIEANGSVRHIICDGMHRIYMALREWVVPQVLFVRGVPKDLPYYAYPAPGGWEKVEERDDLPAGYVKKWHRIANYHALYRDFNSAFKNVGAPRPYREPGA